MTLFALILAGLLFLWMTLTYVTLPGVVPFLQRVFAAAYSLEVALVGVCGSVVGALAGSLAVTLAFAAVAVVAGIPVMRVWRAPDVLGAFGWSPRRRERRDRTVEQQHKKRNVVLSINPEGAA